MGTSTNYKSQQGITSFMQSGCSEVSVSDVSHLLRGERHSEKTDFHTLKKDERDDSTLKVVADPTIDWQ